MPDHSILAIAIVLLTLAGVVVFEGIQMWRDK